ncbi:hypothetical protein [Leptolyngbya sp. 'hensonii']|uniref:hypothetical protein n=1 Tax=Leptolyngbya sp. 'hensonii' TaxID=1922337 RepID=UPI001C0C6F47|nr:hypothetical protein [Leptolyngbya sp. 'hensonii']
MRGISDKFPTAPGIFELLCEVVETDPFVQQHFHDLHSPRFCALKALLTHYPTHTKTI